MRKSAELIIWPSYFDVAKSRNAGRRIGRNLAIERPTVEELAKAAEMSGIPFKIDKSAAYPSAWWEKSGRLFISKTMPKNKILLSIAKNLRKLRTKDTK
jgi:signal recognition particle subunit SRP19